MCGPRPFYFKRHEINFSRELTINSRASGTILGFSALLKDTDMLAPGVRDRSGTSDPFKYVFKGNKSHEKTPNGIYIFRYFLKQLLTAVLTDSGTFFC